jgi:hypothetical protein
MDDKKLVNKVIVAETNRAPFDSRTVSMLLPVT